VNIKAIIIDDEPLAIKVIETHLNEFKNFDILATFNNPIAALEILKQEAIDVIFLDINMSKMNGLEFLKTVDVQPNVVITTAYREYAIESFDLDVLDYLVKPIPFTRFLKAVNKITQKIQLQRGTSISEEENSSEGFIFLKVEKKLVKIKFDTILYIESLKDYIKVSTTTGDHLVHKSLTSITEELPKEKFLRIHRSFTIAIDKVNSIEGNLIEIASKRVPIGRKYVATTKKTILNQD
jgi:DNA-binding LytR/AlgR family response regulator